MPCFESQGTHVRRVVVGLTSESPIVGSGTVAFPPNLRYTLGFGRKDLEDCKVVMQNSFPRLSQQQTDRLQAGLERNNRQAGRASFEVRHHRSRTPASLHEKGKAVADTHLLASLYWL